MRIITGMRRGLKLESNKGLVTRPTESRIKESLFNILGNVSDSIVLDLFSGTGNIGLEFLSRGAKEVIMVDNNSEAIKIIKKNSKKVNLPGYTIINNEFTSAIKTLKGKNFDYIFIDPPYNCLNCYEDSLKLIKENFNLENTLIILEKSIDVEIENINLYKIIDKRKYRSTLLYFLKEE